MPIYAYTAVGGDGAIVRDHLVAPSPADAARRLAARQLSIIDIREQTGEVVSRRFDHRTLLAAVTPVRSRSLILLFRLLTALITSGITISESIMVLYQQEQHPRLRAVLDDLRIKIEGGVALSSAMATHPKVFPPLAVSMIRAGELGGILETVLERLTTYLEKRAALRAKIILSLIYPGIVVLFATGVIAFLVIGVIPRFVTLMGGRQLPWNTQFILDLSKFVTAHLAHIGGGLAAGAGVVTFLLAAPESRLVIDRLRIYLPVVGPVFRLAAVTQFTNTMASLLGAGIPLVDALTATRETIMNTAFRRDLDRGAERIIAGTQLSTVLAEIPIATPMLVAVTRIGEESGTMDQAMQMVAEAHETMLNDRVARMSVMIEPLLILTLGAIVGFVAWALIAGMLSLYSAGR
ncbi:MAG: type II secretion system F family protein [Deltaproteobacteria bacterium]|nr:type II secretion system F family protein [Candidatus Anaeroferrophillacea bacterium]